MMSQAQRSLNNRTSPENCLANWFGFFNPRTLLTVASQLGANAEKHDPCTMRCDCMIQFDSGWRKFDWYDVWTHVLTNSKIIPRTRRGLRLERNCQTSKIAPAKRSGQSTLAFGITWRGLTLERNCRFSNVATVELQMSQFECYMYACNQHSVLNVECPLAPNGTKTNRAFVTAQFDQI